MTGTRGRTRGADFEALVRPHVDHLYRMAFRFTGRREDAEDLVQELLVKLYPRREELAAVEQLRPWLTRVLYRQFVDDYRKRSRMQLVSGGDEHGEPGADPGFDHLASEDPGPETGAGAGFARERLQQALGRLSREHRAVLVLHDVEGYTLVELSEILEVPTGTLKSRLHRARARLRELLGGSGAAEPFAADSRVGE
ncbi:MAG TPA: RNA polymerase sigma factor [Gammaproteobacteria bacterium]|nr:RNA polymerase sigma factor [Gammaproteobacteria bacterium]